MKGFISVEIPTKRYIRAYIISRLGEKPLMNTDHNIGSKLHDVLQHTTNETKTRFSNKRYNAMIKVYISHYLYQHRGGFLNETNIKQFNLFVEREIKKDYRMCMDLFIRIHPSFEANLPEVRKIIGIDLEDWSDDSIKKDYYRYRKSAGLPLIYKNIFAATVPSTRFVDGGF